MLICLVTVSALVLAAAICLLTGSFATLGWLWKLPVSFLGSWILLAGLAFAYLWYQCAKVDLSVPQEQDDPKYRRMLYRYVAALVKLAGVRIHTQGLEQLPADGRFLLVCNHLSDADPVVVHHVFAKNQLAFITKRENMSMFIVGKLMHKTMCQPINRENDREALKTILRCIDLLKQDMVSVAVFPEGYTSTNGLLKPFRHGVFKIAQKAKVPIVVCTLMGTDKVFGNLKHLRPSDVQLDLVGVIQPEELAGVTAVEVGQRAYRMMAYHIGRELVERWPEENA